MSAGDKEKIVGPGLLVTLGEESLFFNGEDPSSIAGWFSTIYPGLLMRDACPPGEIEYIPKGKGRKDAQPWHITTKEADKINSFMTITAKYFGSLAG